MGTVLDDDAVYVVMTEVNGYKNIYGHFLFVNVEDANKAKDEAIERGCWDSVWVSRWGVI